MVVTKRTARRNRWWEWRMLVPLTLGVMFGLGDGVANKDGRLNLGDATLYLRMLMFALVFCCLFSVGAAWLDRWRARVFGADTVDALPAGASAAMPKEREESARGRGPLGWLLRCFDCHWSLCSWARVAGVILLCWLPYVVMLFPGVYWSDTSKQLLEYYGYEPFTDHHPFFLTYVFGWFADLGQALFGNRIFGLYLLIVFQILAAPALFALLLLYLRRIGVGRSACMAGLMFFALCPVFPVMFDSLAKDTLSVLCFLPFCMLFVEIIRTKGAVCSRPWVLPVLFALALLACLTKKPCVYIVVPALIMLAVMPLIRWVKATLAAGGVAVAAVMLVLVPQVVLPALHIQPGGAQETIPFAIQMVAHDVKYGADDMSAEDRRIVSDFLTIPYDDISEAYSPVIADPVKGTSLKDPNLMGDFLTLWARKIVEHPVGNLEAWLGLVQGWFGFRNADGTPSYMVVCTESAWYYDPITTVIPQWPTKAAHSDAARTLYDAEQSLPVVNVWNYRAIWASVLPCFLLYLALRPGKGKFRRVVAMMPVDMTFLYLMMTPVSGMGGEPTRYLLQIMCVLPLFLGAMVVGGGAGGASARAVPGIPGRSEVRSRQ